MKTLGEIASKTKINFNHANTISKSEVSEINKLLVALWKTSPSFKKIYQTYFQKNATSYSDLSYNAINDDRLQAMLAAKRLPLKKYLRDCEYDLAHNTKTWDIKFDNDNFYFISLSPVEIDVNTLYRQLNIKSEQLLLENITYLNNNNVVAFCNNWNEIYANLGLSGKLTALFLKKCRSSFKQQLDNLIDVLITTSINQQTCFNIFSLGLESDFLIPANYAIARDSKHLAFNRFYAVLVNYLLSNQNFNYKNYFIYNPQILSSYVSSFSSIDQHREFIQSLMGYDVLIISNFTCFNYGNKSYLEKFGADWIDLLTWRNNHNKFTLQNFFLDKASSYLLDGYEQRAETEKLSAEAFWKKFYAANPDNPVVWKKIVEALLVSQKYNDAQKSFFRYLLNIGNKSKPLLFTVW